MKMYHKDSTEPIDVHPDSVARMLKQGWSKDSPKIKPSPKKVTDGKP